MAEENQLEFLLSGAEQLQRDGNYRLAEKQFQSALSHAEQLHGADSPNAGQVVLQLMTLYEKLGDESKAAALWKRLREILIVNSKRLKD
jgi:tetratricopeptide (TPR) repeat protein